MPAPELPPEVILHICSWLPPHRRCLFPLLTINRYWHHVIVSELYTSVSVRSLADQYHYLNLFRETRRARLQQPQQGAHFYSATHYAGYVRCLDLSFPYAGKEITDQVLFDLVRDCTSLERLNIYNCHLVSSRGLLAVLEHCPNLRHLHCAMATRLTSKAFMRRPGLLTLNIHGLSPAYVFQERKGKQQPLLPASLTRLSATGWLPLTMAMPFLRELRLDGLQQQTVGGAVLAAFPQLVHLSLKQASIIDAFPYSTLETLELTRCSIDPSVPPMVATTHLHLAHTPIGRPSAWFHPRLVSLTTPPNTLPQDLAHLVEKSNDDVKNSCRLRHLTIMHSPGLSAQQQQHDNIPTTILTGLVSLDTDVDVLSLFPAHSRNHLIDLRMRADTCHWSLDTIPDVFPSLRTLFWSPHVDPTFVPQIDRLGDLCALMISSLYYREPTARLVMLRQAYQHVELARDIW